MATDPNKSFILNHAAQLSENTKAAVLVEIRDDGTLFFSRFSSTQNLSDYALCAWHLSRQVNILFDAKETVFVEGPTKPTGVPT